MSCFHRAYLSLERTCRPRRFSDRICSACRNGDIKTVVQYAQYVQDRNKLLFIATEICHRHLVSHLLKTFIFEKHILNSNLGIAAERGYAELCEMLCVAGANPTAGIRKAKSNIILGILSKFEAERD